MMRSILYCILLMSVFSDGFSQSDISSKEEDRYRRRASLSYNRLPLINEYTVSGKDTTYHGLKITLKDSINLAFKFYEVKGYKFSITQEYGSSSFFLIISYKKERIECHLNPQNISEYNYYYKGKQIKGLMFMPIFREPRKPFWPHTVNKE
jgi:hypothetical protein